MSGDSEHKPANDVRRHFSREKLAVKVGVLAVFAVTIAIAYALLGDALALQNLAQHESQLRNLQEQSPWLVYGAAFVTYVAVTGLSLPGAAVLTLAYGWYFGFRDATILVSFASTAGATLAFLLSRFLFRGAIRLRFGDRLANFNHSLEREGPFFLFTLRLIPAVPFFVINAVMGLTPIKTRTFWWVSQLGMLGGTAVYVYAGASVPNLQALADEGISAVFGPSQLVQIFGAFALLGVFPLAVRYAFKYLDKNKSDETDSSNSGNGQGDAGSSIPDSIKEHQTDVAVNRVALTIN
ncbi:MAG: TVP38/TMEM64 family protein [Planctomycetota bacterium]